MSRVKQARDDRERPILATVDDFTRWPALLQASARRRAPKLGPDELHEVLAEVEPAGQRDGKPAYYPALVRAAIAATFSAKLHSLKRTSNKGHPMATHTDNPMLDRSTQHGWTAQVPPVPVADEPSATAVPARRTRTRAKTTAGKR